MATKENLMGLGVPHHLARRLGRTPVLATAAGTTIADARAIGGDEYDLLVAAGTGGLVMKSAGSVDSGVLLGDEFWISNMTAASVALFFRNAGLGTAVYVNGVSVSGSLGLSIGVGQTCIAKCMTASVWTVIGSVLSN